MIFMTILQIRKLRDREVKRLVMLTQPGKEDFDLNWEPLTPCLISFHQRELTDYSMERI